MRQIVDKKQLAKTRPDSLRDGTQNLYPQGSDQPFQIWDEGFCGILGPSPTLEVVIDAAHHPTFAWEARQYSIAIPAIEEEADAIARSCMGGGD